MVSAFFIQKRIEKGNCEAIETVRWTVSVPGCVPTVAVAGRAILFVSTRKNRNHCVSIWFLFFYSEEDRKGQLLRNIK